MRPYPMSAQRPQSNQYGRSSRANIRRAREVRRRKLRRRRGVALILLLLLLVVSFEVLKPLHKASPPIRETRVMKPNPYAPLPAPRAITPLFHGAPASDGQWTPAGRLIGRTSAVFTTLLHLPDQPTVAAGVAWMDSKLLIARLYSGSLSPGGLTWKYTAPVTSLAAKSLDVAFNGGFLMKDSKGGYYSEGHYADPLVAGAASLVIYKDGLVQIGSWGHDVRMTHSVVAVRQNLVLLINNGQLAPNISATDTYQWGVSLNQVVNTWRSGLGVTATGALVYAYGPMSVLDLADVLKRAGAVRAMVLDMNPAWTVFASYKPSTANGLASPANGQSLLPNTSYGPDRFFMPSYARDFITLSIR